MSAGIPPVDKTPVNTGVPGSTPNPLQSKPFQPTEDTTTSMNETSEDCCFVKILKAIRNFFKSICSCLCGRSKEETKPEVPKTGDGSQNPPPTDPKKLDAFQAEIAARCAKQAGAKQAAERFMTNVFAKEGWKSCVKKFGKISEPDVQWWILHMLIELPIQKMPLGWIGSYILKSEAIKKEVCEKLGIPSIENDLRETTGSGPSNLRELLKEFLKGKVGIEPATPPGKKPTGELEGPKSDGKKTFNPNKPVVQTFLTKCEKEDLPEALKWFSSDACGPLGRVEVLIRMAEMLDGTPDLSNRVFGCLLRWEKLEGASHILNLSKAIGVTSIGAIQQKHKAALVQFLVDHLQALSDAEKT